MNAFPLSAILYQLYLPFDHGTLQAPHFGITSLPTERPATISHSTQVTAGVSDVSKFSLQWIQSSELQIKKSFLIF